MSCPCDQWSHPTDPAIGAGLETIPRQVAGLREFRRAMLASVENENGLSGWRCREEDELGLMLIEM